MQVGYQCAQRAGDQGDAKVIIIPRSCDNAIDHDHVNDEVTMKVTSVLELEWPADCKHLTDEMKHPSQNKPKLLIR